MFAGLRDTGVIGKGPAVHFVMRLSKDPVSLCCLCDSSVVLWFIYLVVCLDEETMALMRSPRCSLPDHDALSKPLANKERRNMKRRRRAISMWTRRNINWRLDFIIYARLWSGKLTQTWIFSLCKNSQVSVSQTDIHLLHVISWSSLLRQTRCYILRLRSYPSSSHLSREMIRSLVYYALRAWAEPTPLEFHEVGLLVWCCINDV